MIMSRELEIALCRDERNHTQEVEELYSVHTYAHPLGVQILYS